MESETLKIYRDGDAWCILYGKDIASGICAFADTIQKALSEFDKAFAKLNGVYFLDNFAKLENYLFSKDKLNNNELNKLQEARQIQTSIGNVNEVAIISEGQFLDFNQ